MTFDFAQIGNFGDVRSQCALRRDGSKTCVYQRYNLFDDECAVEEGGK